MNSQALVWDYVAFLLTIDNFLLHIQYLYLYLAIKQIPEPNTLFWTFLCDLSEFPAVSVSSLVGE